MKTFAGPTPRRAAGVQPQTRAPSSLRALRAGDAHRRAVQQILEVPTRGRGRPQATRIVDRPDDPFERKAEGIEEELPEEAPNSVQQALQTTGRALDDRTRVFMESRFGSDFAQVRVHAGGRAAASARELGARAYTVGRDLVFGAGEYSPDTPAGRRLLAHELTHVLQQGQSSAAADRLQRAVYRVRNVDVNIDYGNIIRLTAADYARAIERRFTALTSVPALGIRPQVAALPAAAQRWVLFGIDLLADNRAAAPGLDLTAAIARLIAHAPSARQAPLSGAFRSFPEEVLTVSGWYEIALSRYPPLSSLRQQLAEHYINPGQAAANSSSCPDPRPASQQLDTTRFRARLPVQLKAYLVAHAPAAGQTTQPIATMRTIADVVQAAARRFFSPYAGRGRRNPWSEGWRYSAHLTSSQASPPSQQARLEYLKSRARIVGNRGLFAQVHFDPRCPTDVAELVQVAQSMEAKRGIRTRVNAILQELSYTIHRRPKEVVLDTSRPAGTPACAARWSVIETVCHELMHVMAHDGFRAQAARRQVMVEGVPEVLGDQLYGYIRRRAGSSAAYRSRFEAGLANCPATIPAPTLGYGAAGQRAADLRRVVGDRRLRIAFFLGRPELIGVQPKLLVAAPRDRFEVEADRVADAVVREPAPARDPTGPSRQAPAGAAAPLVQPGRVAPRIQASPVDTPFGRFNDDYYSVLMSGRAPIGLQMVMSFLPGERVDASKIALVQIARTVRGGEAYFQSEGHETRRSRAVSAADARPTPSSALPTDEGFGIDRAPSHVSPLYVVGEDRRSRGPSTLAEGESEGPIRELTPQVMERLRTRHPRITSGARFGGYGRHGSRQGADDRPVSARLADSPRTVPALDSEQLLETAALAVEGRQRGTYYGSVQWGWRIDSRGRFSKLPMAPMSQGAPSSTFLAAAQLWNRGQDAAGRANIPLPAPEVHVIRHASVALYAGPHDRILEIRPIGHLLPGTRVEMRAGTDAFDAQVRVVDCPPVRGYVDITRRDLPPGTGDRAAEAAIPVFAGPHDHLLEIPPIARLEPGQRFRVLSSDGFVARIVVDSCALMDRTGYLGNLDPGHQDERPEPAARESGGPRGG